jgi:hypothetical protein
MSLKYIYIVWSWSNIYQCDFGMHVIRKSHVFMKPAHLWLAFDRDQI